MELGVFIISGAFKVVQKLDAKRLHAFKKAHFCRGLIHLRYYTPPASFLFEMGFAPLE